MWVVSYLDGRACPVVVGWCVFGASVWGPGLSVLEVWLWDRKFQRRMVLLRGVLRLWRSRSRS